MLVKEVQHDPTASADHVQSIIQKPGTKCAWRSDGYNRKTQSQNAIPGSNKAYKDIQRHADDSNVRALTGSSTCAQEILHKIHGCTSADDERYVPRQSARKDWGPKMASQRELLGYVSKSDAG